MCGVCVGGGGYLYVVCVMLWGGDWGQDCTYLSICRIVTINAVFYKVKFCISEQTVPQWLCLIALEVVFCKKKNNQNKKPLLFLM